MAEKCFFLPHSISSLIYVETDGKARGYREDLVKEGFSEISRQFLMCPECKGVIRDAVRSKGRTVCESCTTGIASDTDKNVQYNVSKLKCRCPLSNEGCNWSGVLGTVREHLDSCVVLLVECPAKCGEVLQKGGVVEHQMRSCSLRLKQCDFCNQQVQSNKENNHAKECLNHPENVVTCPYKEIGCNTLEILRKNLDGHLKEKFVTHQDLLLTQFNCLQANNRQLNQINEELRNKLKLNNSGVWIILLAVLAVGLAMLVTYQMEYNTRFEKNIFKLEFDNKILIKEQALVRESMDEVSKQYERIELRFKKFIDSINKNVSDVERGLQNLFQKVSENGLPLEHELRLGQSIKSLQYNITLFQRELQKQLDERLPAVSRYIKERDKILQGVVWTHEYIESDIILHGPKFYLGLCRLRIHAKFGYKNKKSGLSYYVTRLNGDYDGGVTNCHITYICHFYQHLDGTKSSTLDEKKDNYLEIEDQLSLSHFHYGYNFKRTELIQDDKVTVKFYLDSE